MRDSRWLIKTKMTPRKAVQFADEVGGEATAVVVVTLTAATHNDVRKLEHAAGTTVSSCTGCPTWSSTSWLKGRPRPGAVREVELDGSARAVGAQHVVSRTTSGRDD